MSYEGFSQLICKNGHYWTEDAMMSMYDEEVSKCPKCSNPAIWENMVDETNGSHDEDGERIDGFIKLKVKSKKSGACSECGEEHVCEVLYEIPVEEEE